MNLREVFDTVKAHLLAQGVQARQDASCRYRTDNGRMCAVGVLIKDHYRPECEGSTIHHLVVRERWKGAVLANALNDAGIPASSQMKELLVRLQIVHDQHSPEQWPAALDEVERDHLGGA